MDQLITRARFARLAGVSRPSVTKACKNGLKDAVVGKRIDLTHPAARQYLADKGVDATTVRPAASRIPRGGEGGPGKSEAAGTDWGPGNVEDLLGLTFREIAVRYGTVPGFTDWLNARKKVADIRRLELRNAESEGRVIQRDLVRTHVFGYLDAMNRRLLRDLPPALAPQLLTLARTNASAEDFKKEIRARISHQLRNAKHDVTRRLSSQKEDSP